MYSISFIRRRLYPNRELAFDKNHFVLGSVAASMNSLPFIVEMKVLVNGKNYGCTRDQRHCFRKSWRCNRRFTVR